MEYYYKDGIIHENSEYGNAIGNIDNGVIRDGWCIGNGNALGNVDNGVIRDGWCIGNGNAIGNVDGNTIRDGWCQGNGSEIGNVRDYIIHGMEDRPAEMVACWHFLIRKIF